MVFNQVSQTKPVLQKGKRKYRENTHKRLIWCFLSCLLSTRKLLLIIMMMIKIRFGLFNKCFVNCSKRSSV